MKPFQYTRLKVLNNLKLVDLKYLENKHNVSKEFKHHVFDNVLSSLRDDLIPEDQRETAEADNYFKNESDPDGANVPFNWNEFYKYLTLDDLNNASYFINNTANNPTKMINFTSYVRDYGRDLFRKECIN